jgi:glutathione S-transferase
MILVGQYDSFYVRRVAVSLHLLGVPFSRNTISVFSNAEEMRRINPLGRIPSLVLDGGEVLIDSAAILDHVDEVVGPERALLPSRGPERRRALRLMALATGTIDKAGAIVYERTLRPAEKRYAPWEERCRIQVATGLLSLERDTGSTWYLGGRPLQPDITVACMVSYLRHRLPEVLKSEHPRLERLCDAAESLEAFQRTRPAEDEKMPDAPIQN